MGEAVIQTPWRCDVTGNPVGTDTFKVGSPCRCQGCRAADLIDSLIKERDEARAKAIEECAKVADKVMEARALGNEFVEPGYAIRALLPPTAPDSEGNSEGGET